MKRLKNVWLPFALSMCLGLLVMSACLLFNPPTVLADDFATGSAKCSSGSVVRCVDGATGCHCVDYDGCTSTMSDGTTTKTKCDPELLY